MEILELMHDRVRAIYRAATGRDLPEGTEGQATDAAPPPADTLATRFAELERLALSIPSVAERLPVFSFAPPTDVIDTERELIVELAVPGVDRGDVRTELSGQRLVVSGALNGRYKPEAAYYQVEIPRGPFSRVVELPHAVVGEPRIEVDRGLIKIRVSKAAKTAPARA